MNFKTGKINSFWPLKDIETLEYFYEPFTDLDTINKWTKLYNQKFSTGLQADYRSQQPSWTKKILKELLLQDIVLKNIATSYYKMMPGDILPEHCDTYASYCRYYSTQPKNVFRVIIFLQDWHPGFLFEIAGNPIMKYSAGHYVGWSYNTPHMAGNIGKIPRYTLQVTGTLI
jgi:hypothetical protein